MEPVREESKSLAATPPQGLSMWSLPEGMRKAIAGAALATSAFFIGCGKSNEELVAEIRALPQPTVAVIHERENLYLDMKIAVNGAPILTKDDSYVSTTLILVPHSVGKSTVLVPTPILTTHTDLWYSMRDGDDEGQELKIHSSFHFEPTATTVSGTLQRDASGNVYLEAENSSFAKGGQIIRD